MKLFVGLLALAATVSADVYFHIPRGSNNRLNENSAERRNGNRLFDSQNNNRGGYNVGDRTDQRSSNEEQQYRMQYFMSSEDAGRDGQSILTLEWTNQHGCGGNEETDPQKQNCNIVLQYMCQKNSEDAAGDRIDMRNGRTTNTNDYQPPGNAARETESQYQSRFRNKVRTDRGYHESFAWYDKCRARNRNEGLFTADQQLRGDGAIHTRQNPNGDRRGYECPEERDYYPYWHPTPWKDIAVLTDNVTRCDYFRANSFNVRSKHECLENWFSSDKKKHYSSANNQADCEERGGQWTEIFNYLERLTDPSGDRIPTEAACKAANRAAIFAVPHDHDGGQKECLVPLAAPDCEQADFSRVNHLGNGPEGVMNNYEWKIPHFLSGNGQRCVLRIRYNITTDDYDPVNTDSRFNGLESPVKNNPQVTVASDAEKLQLAVNTAQFGRTFQDRSHVFLLVPRPAGAERRKIHNLNVRGKRGNIVQTFPAVEYDFHPNDLEISTEDLVHIQWTGSNSHNNQNPAGDGQAGDAGEGRGGTDRHNLVQIQDRESNYPRPFEWSPTMWSDAKVVWMRDSESPDEVAEEDLAISMASSGYFKCMSPKTWCSNSESAQGKRAINNLLDNAPASYEGALVRFSSAGTFHYMCTRNNNFSNRSQKGTITVR